MITNCAKIPIQCEIKRHRRHYVYLTKSFTTKLQTMPADSDYENAKPFSEIPGPTAFGFFKYFLPGGEFHNIEPVELQIALNKQYGTILRLPGLFGKKDMIFTYEPKDFEKVFRTEGIWPKRRAFAVFDYFRRNVRADVYKNIGGLINDQGEAWAHMRSVINPIMLKPKTIRAYIPVIDDVAKDFVGKMKTMKDEKQEMPATFGFELSKWALESTAVIALEQRLGVITNENDPECQKIIKSVKDMLHLGFKAEIMPPVWQYFRTPMFNKFLDAFNTMTDVSKKYVDNAVERISNGSKGTFKVVADGDESVLEKLLKINSDYAFVMAMDMLLAGIDTTSAAVADLLYHLAKNPLKQEKLREEIMRILPDIDSKLTPESFSSIPYMRACLKESMRLTPPIPGNLRTTGKDLVLQGYQIPKNTDIAMGAALLQLDDDHFKQSKEFLPERWLSGHEMEGKYYHPFSFLPFGFGSRSCIGKRLAEIEASVLIFRILKEFKVEWHYGPLKFEQSLVIFPSSELKFKILSL